MLYRFVENVFNYVKFCAARFARRSVIYLVLYIVYADGGNIHGPLFNAKDQINVIVWHKGLKGGNFDEFDKLSIICPFMIIENYIEF